jgi:hypothetical protein
VGAWKSHGLYLLCVILPRLFFLTEVSIGVYRRHTLNLWEFTVTVDWTVIKVTWVYHVTLGSHVYHVMFKHQSLHIYVGELSPTDSSKQYSH